MSRRIIKIMSVMIMVVCLVGWSDNEYELIAPGGGDMDMQKNVMRYYASSSKPVTASWQNYYLEAKLLEYHREQAIVKGIQDIKLVQTKPELRTLKCNEIVMDLNREFYTAYQNVSVYYDAVTSMSGEKLECDQKKEWMLLTGNPILINKNWKITGERVEGFNQQGIFLVVGSVYATDNEMIIKAGKLTYEREAERYILEDNPIVIKEKNRLVAPKFIYDLKTKKVFAEGMVKSNIITEKK